MAYLSDRDYADAIKRRESRAIAQLLEECTQDFAHRKRESVGLYKTVLAQNEEDLSQETAILVINGINTYNEMYKFSTWRKRIGQNKFYDLLNKLNLRKELNFGDAPKYYGSSGIESIFEDKETQEPWEELSENEEYRIKSKIIWRAISKLPEKTRDVVMLQKLRQMKIKETARILGIPAGTVKSQGHEAIKRLRALAKTA